MINYIKPLYHILKNYHFYSIYIILYEIYFNIKYNKKFNQFKYLKSNIFSDSIPCSFFFLQKIKKFVKKNKVLTICDLGSGYGKIIYFFGIIGSYKIDGVELDKEIFNKSKFLINDNIKIINKNILNYDLDENKYQLLILNDPLKKLDDLENLIKYIASIKYSCHIVLINMTEDKYKIIKKNLKIIETYKISKSKNIIFCGN